MDYLDLYNQVLGTAYKCDPRLYENKTPGLAPVMSGKILNFIQKDQYPYRYKVKSLMWTVFV
jgi:hypothetical protein